MVHALRERRRESFAAAVALVGLVITAGCDRAVKRSDQPLVIVSAGEALAGFRVPEFFERVPEPEEPRVPPMPLPVPPPVPVPKFTPAPRPEWAAANARPWRFIVIHHSETARGNAAIFDRYHLLNRGWENGLGYHFVIGNGTDSGDGAVEVGSRWRRQIQGAHAGVALYNEYGIGICLVGDFETGRPTRRQLAALVELVNYLSAAYGIPRERILRHGDIKNTKCPGRHFPFEALFRS